jgi:D-glycero-D-manno-heptose 1,7-bisphosphate phosphatase
VNRAVFLDRDGVLNRAVVRGGRPYPPGGLGELEVMPDAPAALARLKKLGFLLIVVSNQPDVGRGTQRRAVVEAMNQALRAVLPLDEFRTCYHDDRDDCACRKPKPGLLREASVQHSIDLPRSYLIGDRWRDVDAGAAAGCRTILIDYGYQERGPTGPPDARVETLAAAVEWIEKTEREAAA